MRTDRRKVSGIDHHLMAFDSLADFVSENRKEDHRSSHMSGGFYGANSMQEAWQMATDGLAREGVEALELAERGLESRDRELNSQRFQPFASVEGADVNIGAYLAGEPECMVDYRMDSHETMERVITVVVGCAVNCAVSTEAITKHGQALVALAEAIDSCGLQSEIWVDLSIDGTKAHARIAVRLKAAGELFDIGAFMFALTSPAMLRALGFNAWHSIPGDLQKKLGIGSYYGYPNDAFGKYQDDYPEGSIFIPNITSSKQAGNFLTPTLRKLGLIDEDD